MNPLAIPLPVAVRRHGEIVGIIFGIVCFPFALYAGALGGIFPNGPAALILPIVMLSAFAGAIASATVDAAKAPDIGGVPLRIGARAGVVASLVAGGCTVLASTFHSFGIGSPPSGGFGWNFLQVILPSSPAIALALLALPPSVFFGLTGALLAEILKSNAGETGARTPSKATGRTEKSAAFRFALLLTIGCYLSPLLVTLKPAPKPAPVAAVAPKPTPAATPTPRPTPQPPPPWRYQMPDSFNTAEAGRIIVTEQRSLGEIAKGLPAAMSPDGLRFACCRGGERTQVQITDLESLDVLASAQAPESPGAFAWSPDSKMLLIVSEGEQRSLTVMDVAKARMMALPLPRGARLPEGRPIWWVVQRVAFARGEKVSSVLNLETLRVEPADASPLWNALGNTEQLDILRGAATHLPRNERWEMQIGTALRSYSISPDAPEQWKWSFSLQVVLVDRRNAHRFLLPSVRADWGDGFTASRDGTRLIRIHDEQATAFFMGLRQEPPTRFKISMSEAPEASMTGMLAKKNVAAFVCAPVINPLNGKTVAPNRSLVKAIVRVAKWQDKMAEFWIDENYIPVQPGDVVCDPHTWEATKPHPAGQFCKNEWFAVIESLDSASTPPARADAADLEREPALVIDSSGGTDRAEKVAPDQVNKRASNNVPPPKPTAAEPVGDMQKKLTDFLILHHAKSSRGDVNGLIADYGEKVNHFNNGIVDRAFIRKDESEYHSSGTRVTETIITLPSIKRLPSDGNTWSVNYSISYHRVRSDGRWTKGISDVSLIIEVTNDGPLIVSQHAQTHDQQKGP